MDRINSVLKMTSEVFLKNDRSQNADALYKEHSKISITATINKLRCLNVKKAPKNIRGWDQIKKYVGDVPEYLGDWDF